jgi:hypothetical protein
MPRVYGAHPRLTAGRPARDAAAMLDDPDLLGPDDIAYHLELTAVEMKVTHTALHTLRDGLGHEEHEVREIVQRVLDKLPGDHDIRAIIIP